MTALEFPGGTFLLVSALFLFPARYQILFPASLITEKKKHLPLNMSWDSSPPLLIAMYRFNRYAKEIRQLLLCFFEFFSRWNKFIFVHNNSFCHTF